MKFTFLILRCFMLAGVNVCISCVCRCPHKDRRTDIIPSPTVLCATRTWPKVVLLLNIARPVAVWVSLPVILLVFIVLEMSRGRLMSSLACVRVRVPWSRAKSFPLRRLIVFVLYSVCLYAGQTCGCHSTESAFGVNRKAQSLESAYNTSLENHPSDPNRRASPIESAYGA